MADRGRHAPHLRSLVAAGVNNAMLRQFPFRILGFHSDNGSEFISRPWPGC